jgi:predicted amino acid racemase
MTKLEETEKEISRLKNANRGAGTKFDIFNTYMLMDIARSLAKIADNTSELRAKESEE